MTDVVVGIDIGGTNIVFGLVTRDGKIIAENALKTADYPDFDFFVETATNLIKGLVEKANANLLGVGIGAPDANFYKGTIEHAHNLAWHGIVPVGEKFAKSLGLDIVVTNDANAAAIGEKIFGGAKDIDDFVVLTLGTGLGSGIYINGKVVYGHTGFAGELGHISLVENGRVCGCGQLGCAEAYVSATGICRTAFELLCDMEMNETSLLREYSYNELSSKKIFDAAKKGDKIAIEAFDITAKYLGKMSANTLAFSSPQKIFLFGGLANAGDILIKPATEYARQMCLEPLRKTFEVELSKLPAANAAVLGAAALGWEKLDN